MAFLSLGLNIEEPQSLEESQEPAKELSEASHSGNVPAAVASKHMREESQVTSNETSNNGTNGAPQTVAKPTEAATDNWPEMGMQIIQSVLRGAQTRESVASSEPTSAEQISDLPS